MFLLSSWFCSPCFVTIRFLVPKASFSYKEYEKRSEKRKEDSLYLKNIWRVGRESNSMFCMFIANKYFFKGLVSTSSFCVVLKNYQGKPFDTRNRVNELIYYNNWPFSIDSWFSLIDEENIVHSWKLDTIS